MEKAKILFDGNCIVCDLEITHYQKLYPELFQIVDIAAPGFDARNYNLTADAVNKEMHVITPKQELKVGVDAFVYIWEQMPRYRFLAQLTKLPGLYSIAKVGYAGFARIRPYLPKKKSR